MGHNLYIYELLDLQIRTKRLLIMLLIMIMCVDFVSLDQTAKVNKTFGSYSCNTFTALQLCLRYGRSVCLFVYSPVTSCNFIKTMQSSITKS